ncbi:hypothetical protein ZWY2020_018738 [Hordeum vulgare]|nr:hypothetical protein ZWY2020_018738 [Hordeum vulgare]
MSPVEGLPVAPPRPPGLGSAPEAAAAGGRGPSLCFTRSPKSWADWAEAEEGDDPMEHPVSLAPLQLGIFLAAARPARRRTGSEANRRNLSDRRPLRPSAGVPRPSFIVARPAAPPELSPTVAPGSRAGGGLLVAGSPCPATPVAPVPWSGPALAARLRGVNPSATGRTVGGSARCRPGGPPMGGLGDLSAEEVEEAARRAREAVDSANRTWELAHEYPARWLWIQHGGPGPWDGWPATRAEVKRWGRVSASLPRSLVAPPPPLSPVCPPPSPDSLHPVSAPSPPRTFLEVLMTRVAEDGQARPKRPLPPGSASRPATNGPTSFPDAGVVKASFCSGWGGADRPTRSRKFYSGTSLRCPPPPRDPTRNPRLPLPGSRGDARRQEAARLWRDDEDREDALSAEMVARQPAVARVRDVEVPWAPVVQASATQPSELDWRRGRGGSACEDHQDDGAHGSHASARVRDEARRPAHEVELAAYIGDFRDSEFTWEVTETAPLVFSVPFPSAELLRVCSHDLIRCPINKILISVHAAAVELDHVPPLEKVWVLFYGLPRGNRPASRGGKLEHILKAISEPVGKLVTADLASFEDDGPARIEILCPAPARLMVCP